MALQLPISGASPSFNICSSHLPSIPSFYALGDSYSAGIGANCGWIKDEFDSTGDCRRCAGAFPFQVIEVANSSSCMQVYHIGCTGALMNDIVNTGWENRTSQIELMNTVAGNAGWGTLTIGGNDVGFSKVVGNCVMRNLASCDADMNSTESILSSPELLAELSRTYLSVLEAAEERNFRLIVPSYAQFFNAETELCNNHYLFTGRYLTQELRVRVNKMVSGLNLIIEMAVAIVQLHLVFSNSRKAIFFENWDELFEGHRFCEEIPRIWSDSWFFTIYGPDLLPNDTTIMSGANLPDGNKAIDLTSVDLACGSEGKDNVTAQIICGWAREKAKGREPVHIDSNMAYPWQITKTMHPKSIAHRALGKVIFKKWVNGEYF